jgi:hypothetical protein
MEFSFTEATEVESIDKVPEDFRPLYQESGDGKYVLADNLKPVTGAITRFQAALKAARAEAKGKTTIDLSPLQDYGTSPEEILSSVNAKIELLETAAAGSKEAKLNVDKVKEDLGKAHAIQLSQKEAKVEAYKKQLDKLLINNVAQSAIAELKGDADLLMPHLIGHIQSVEEDGQFKVFVVDQDKNKRFSGVTAEPMTIKELVQEFKASQKFARLFESEAPSGGGLRPGSTGQANRLGRDPNAKLSATEKIAKGLGQAKR